MLLTNRLVGKMGCRSCLNWLYHMKIRGLNTLHCNENERRRRKMMSKRDAAFCRWHRNKVDLIKRETVNRIRKSMVIFRLIVSHIKSATNWCDVHAALFRTRYLRISIHIYKVTMTVILFIYLCLVYAFLYIHFRLWRVAFWGGRKGGICI